MTVRTLRPALVAILSVIGILSTEPCMSNAAPPALSPQLALRIEDQPKAISPDLFGIFFEDLNYAADGGLYAELIQNRSFDFQATENPTWNALTAWETIRRGEAKGGVQIDAAVPIHGNNPTYAVLEVHEPGSDPANGGVGVANDGFDGIAVRAGESYEASFFARQLYVGGRWGGRPSADPAITQPRDGARGPLIVRLESKSGEVLAEASLGLPGDEWTRVHATLAPTRSDDAARFVLLMNIRGGVALDMISLFPTKTFHGRANGLRADLAQNIADLKPRFVRFPGGCLVHGNGVGNMYRWKDTIGPIETRRGQANLWRYHQSMGLGFFEYFQFCEDIGAMPLPVVPSGVSCQNSAFTGGIGQRGIPMEEMPAYVQEVLDLVEYANGPSNSKWGSKRAAAGHPEPFGLKYLGVGNEEHITPAFQERFKLIHDAIKAMHPEITVVGTVGPNHSGPDYDAGWEIARVEKVALVDEHYYVPVDWFWEHLDFYDKYDRTSAHVYLGEYAAHERDRKNTLRSALAEAAYMTSLERNGDIVRFASYAPLLSRRGHTQWTPDLIYFDATTVSPSVNYQVQKLFALNAGDLSLPLTIENADSTQSENGKMQFSGSCVRDSQSGELIVKLVSRYATPIQVKIDFGQLIDGPRSATGTVLSGDPMAENPFGKPPTMMPVTTEFETGPMMTYELPANALGVIRVKSR